jgi:hypothetical protein
MAETVRCPMCGKPNPAELEVCQFCQARLKPLIIKQPPELEKPAGPVEPAGPTEANEVPAGEGGEGGADWLQDLRGQNQTPEEPAGEEETPPKEEGKETPDWLARVIARKKAELGDKPPLGEFVIKPPKASDEDLSWLDSIRGREDQGGKEAEAPQHEESVDEGDWLAGLREAEPGEQWKATAPLHPRWEDQPKEKGAEEPAEELPAQERTEPEELPDLSSLLAEGGEETAGELPSEEHAESEELPDLSSFLAEGTPPSGQPEEPAAAGLEGADWLERIPQPPQEKGQPQEEEPAHEEELPIPKGGEVGESSIAKVPDWLEEVAGLGLEGETGEAVGEGAPPGGEGTGWAPDWLASSVFSGVESGAAETEEEKEGGAEEGEELPSLEQGEIPEWLQRVRAQKAADMVEPEPSPFLEEAEITPPEEEKIEERAGAEVPDWLAQVKPAEETHEEAAEGESPPSEGEQEVPLAPAELPSWVQAMRPIETAAPSQPVGEEADRWVEKAGPLAGLQGILPAESLGEISKPPLFSVRLQVSEQQRVQASLLENLLASEAVPQQPRPEAIRAVPQRVLRAVIAVLLLVAVIAPVVTGIQIAPLPQLFPPETVALRDMIAALPADAPVLVAADFQPALAGEIRTAAAGVLDQLMAHGARLALISTQPSGSALMQAMLDDLLNNRPDFQALYREQGGLVNLGYLPGGAAGLADFAAFPQLAAPCALDAVTLCRPAWDTPALQGVTSLSGFSLVILITDNSDLGRAWIEQIGPKLGATPLGVIASAQAAPLLLPYYDSGQVKGMVAGINGGAAFEEVVQVAGAARTQWDPFQAGLIAAIALILIGGLVNVILILLAQQRAKREAN